MAGVLFIAKRNNAISDPNGVAARLQQIASQKMNIAHTSLSVKRKATVRMSTSICMYMPPTVEVKYGAISNIGYWISNIYICI